MLASGPKPSRDQETAHLERASAPSTFVLPIDLYRVIVETIENRKTLLSLCRASKALGYEAQRVLYSDVAFDMADQAGHLAFLRTITEGSPLALLVLRYRVPYLRSFGTDEQNPLDQLLHSALKAMVNLRELFLPTTTHGFYANRYSRSFILDNCRFQLETLHLIQHVDGMKLFSFLGTQSNIRKLTAYLQDQVHLLPIYTVCPSLDSLQGNRSAIDALLPNHRITTLIWDPDYYDPTRSIPQISEPLRILRALSFQGSYLRPSLGAIVDHLQALEYLELVALHDGETHDICKLTALRTLVLTDAFSLATWDQRISTISPIFESCKKLEHVDIEQLHSSDYKELYQRWAYPRGSTFPMQLGTYPKNIVRRQVYTVVI